MIQQLIDKLLKGAWKEVMRNGVKYYATGPHAGKIVGSIRGNKTPKSDEPKSAPKQNITDVLPKIKVNAPIESNVKIDIHSSQEPERSGSKTTSVAAILSKGYGSRATGKLSGVPYRSPKGSTCNLVGYVAFGKTSKDNQAELNEKLRNAEVVLSHMGVRFKTPIDFTCQQLKEVNHGTQASFLRYNSPVLNSRIDISKGGPSIQKSIMHEVGHALDFAMAEAHAFRSSEIKMTGAPAELKEAYDELAKIVRSSDYYTIGSTTKFTRYLNTPTEVFARAFEVYTYTKGKKLASEGKLSPSFHKDFKPDVFKTKNDKLSQVEQEIKALSNAPGPDLDKLSELHEIASQIRRSGTAWVTVAPEKQKEYETKIESLMDLIVKNDKIRKALLSIDLVGKLRKGHDSKYYVAVVPVNPMGEVLLGERREDGIWTTPCGGAENGEDPREVAVRECFEEAGLKIDQSELELLSVKAAPNGRPVWCFLWRAPLTGSVTTRLDPDKEVKKWDWYLPESDLFPREMQRKKNRNRLETVNEALMKFHGLTKAEFMDKKKLAEKLLEKGGPGSGIRGHKTAMQTSAITKHPRFDKEDYDNLKRKGYSDKEVKAIWDRDSKSNARPVGSANYDKNKPSLKDLERETFRQMQNRQIKDYMEKPAKERASKELAEAKARADKKRSERREAYDNSMKKGGPGSGVVGHRTNRLNPVRKQRYNQSGPGGGWAMRRIDAKDNSHSVPMHPEHWKEVQAVHEGKKESSSFKDETGKTWKVDKHPQGGVKIHHHSINGKFEHHIEDEHMEHDAATEKNHLEAYDRARKERSVSSILDQQKPSKSPKTSNKDMGASGVGRILARQFRKSTDKDIQSLTEKLLKGGPGSGVKGHKTAEEPKNRLQTHLKALKDGAVLPNVATASGKPIVTDMFATRAHNYGLQDHLDAIDVHHKMAKRIGEVAEKLKAAGKAVPKEAQDMVKFHIKQMRSHMREHDSMEMKHNQMQMEKENRNSGVKKSVAFHLTEKLAKGAWKEVMRQGVKYYATGPHAGKIVGSIRGNKTPKSDAQSKPAAAQTAASNDEDKQKARLNRVIDLAREHEGKGTAFFSRHGDKGVFHVRGAHGNDPNQWKNAREIQDALGSIAGEIKPDPQSGTLVIEVRGIYPKQENPSAKQTETGKPSTEVSSEKPKSKIPSTPRADVKLWNDIAKMPGEVSHGDSKYLKSSAVDAFFEELRMRKPRGGSMDQQSYGHVSSQYAQLSFGVDRYSRQDHGGGPDGDDWMDSGQIRAEQEQAHKEHGYMKKQLEAELKKRGIKGAEVSFSLGEKGHFTLDLNIRNPNHWSTKLSKVKDPVGIKVKSKESGKVWTITEKSKYGGYKVVDSEGNTASLGHDKEYTIEKSQTQMGGGFGDPDLDTGDFAQASANGDQSLQQRLYRGMDGYNYGDAPREFAMDKGILHLSKVDDGMYSGYFTQRDASGLEDNARVRIDKINIPDLVALVQAKEWQSQVKSEKSVMQPPQAVTDNLDMQPPPQAIMKVEPLPAPPSAPVEVPKSQADKTLRVLELISKLVGS